jgi:hypothetical protein
MRKLRLSCRRSPFDRHEPVRLMNGAGGRLGLKHDQDPNGRISAKQRFLEKIVLDQSAKPR